jgi:uncharacterized membrane protein YhaH (DUF805 family)
MFDNSLIVVVIIFFGLLVLSLTAYFAWKIYTREWKDVLGTCYPTPTNISSAPLPLQKIKDAYGDFLEKRNDFWFGFGQIIIVGLIIIVLTVLLLLGKISPEAGLSIISALSGFAIAKTTNTAKSKTEPEQTKG